MYTKSQQQVGAHILSESTIDKDSLVPKLGPSVRSGRELEREGGTVPERVDEGRNVIFITFPYSGSEWAKGNSEQLRVEDSDLVDDIALLILALVVPRSTIDQLTFALTL